MPVNRGYEKRNGRKYGYYQWGSQKKYYYKIGSKDSRQRAYRKAKEQREAVYSSGYEG